MRIKDIFNSRSIDSINSKAESPTKVGNASIFTAMLNQKQTDIGSYAQEMFELKKDIDEAGDNLEQEPNLENFRKFRNLLSQIAKRVSGEAYRLEKIEGTPLNPRYFEVISVIDKEADQLYQLIIHEQRNHIAIIAKVIGIKGLVVSLMT